MRAFMKRLASRGAAYQRMFLGDDDKLHRDAEIVLADLKRFCYVERPTVNVSAATGMIDPLAMAVAEGRREVFMRIVAHMHLDEAAIHNLQEPTQRDD